MTKDIPVEVSQTPSRTAGVRYEICLAALSLFLSVRALYRAFHLARGIYPQLSVTQYSGTSPVRRAGRANILDPTTRI